MEEAIVNLFKEAFDDHTVRHNLVWKYDGQQFETDLLIKIDSHLFIVEAKSNKISWPALRGAPDRMKREIAQLIETPSLQSKRLEDALREAQLGTSNKLEIPDINVDEITEYTRLSITLEDFSTIQSNLTDIVEAGLLSENFPKAVTMSFADLESVFEILESPIEKMHYLQRRKTIQEKWRYLADERDILGLYLDTGLHIENFDKSENSLIAAGMSKKIDNYFQVKELNINIQKPQRKFTKWFIDMRDRLAAVRPKRWTEAALMLLDVSFEDQKNLESHFDKISRARIKDRRNPNTTAAYPPAWRKTGFACVAYFDDERAQRHNMMTNAALGVFDNSEAERCLVIGQNISRPELYPYESLAIFDRSETAAAS